jgi:lipopolysaccharide/colanic/teichoic acid biosynthesis glycosyltransferase
MGDMGDMGDNGATRAVSSNIYTRNTGYQTMRTAGSDVHIHGASLNATAVVQPPRVATRVYPALERTEPHAIPRRGSGLLVATWWQRAGKRIMDITIAMVAIALLSVFLLATSLAVGLTSRGPVFYKQTRVGRGGKEFTLWKFRSMRRGAHAEKEQLLGENEKDGPVFKIRNDPRVTRVGRTIRKYSIDELPQLLQVLTGKMSLVGPRPPLPEEVATYTAHQRRRLDAKPGLTCIWQTSGRSDIAFDQWVDMDIEYIETFSLRLDLELLVKTVPAVLAGDGAY